MSVSSNEKFTVFVGGLNFDTKEIDLMRFFSSYPEIDGIEDIQICNRIEGSSKGFGYVTFNNHPSFLKSLSLNGNYLNGNRIRVEMNFTKQIIPFNNSKEGSFSILKSKKSKKYSKHSDSYSSYSYSSYSYSSYSYSSSSYSSDDENQKKKHKKKKQSGNYSDYSS